MIEFDKILNNKLIFELKICFNIVKNRNIQNIYIFVKRNIIKFTEKSLNTNIRIYIL